MNKFFTLSSDSIRQMLMPLIRLCLRKSIGISELTEIIKKCLIDAAKEEMYAAGEKLNTSRLSVMTGMQRREVSRLLENSNESKDSQTLVARIIGQWQHDVRFITKAGEPKILSYEGNNSEFAKLVSAVSKDVHHGTVLFDLKRLQAVEIAKGGIKLINKVQNVRSDPRKAFEVVAADISGLVNSTLENLYSDDEVPNLQARTEYDNVFISDLPEIKEWLLKEGSVFHRKAREYLAGFDKDLNPHIKKTGGGKVSLSTFSLIEKRKQNETD